MINKVFIKNFCGISELSFSAKKFNLFTGHSLQGKTTIIDSLRWAIVGGNEDFYIKDKEEECEVKFTTDTGILVERKKLRGGKSRLYVYRNDKPIDKPQAVLDSVYHRFLFSPIDLILLKPKDQVEFINTIISKKLKIKDEQLKEWGIEDIDKDLLKQDPIKALEKYYKMKYDERTAINKAVDSVNKQSNYSKTSLLTDTEIADAKKNLELLQKQRSIIYEKNIKIEAANKNKELAKSLKDNKEKLENEIASIEIETINDSDLNELINKESKKLDSIKINITNKRQEYKNKKETLEKINKNEIKCPISNNIICKTNMSPYAETLQKENDQLEKDIKLLMSEGESLSKNISKNKILLENSKELETKKNELTRVINILENLSFTDEKPEDINKIEKEIKEIEEKLIENDVRKSISSNINNNKELINEQQKIDSQVKNIRNIIDVKIPELTKINIPNIELNQDGLLYKGRPLFREGKSAQLRIATAILKDIDKVCNLYTLDEMERLDQHTLKKYLDGCCSSSDQIQYFGTYVGELKFTVPTNCNVFNIKQFKIME